jgi:DNA-binding transcriptional ArsR family regulator
LRQYLLAMTSKPSGQEFADPKKVAAIRERLIAPADAAELASRFQLLADPVRLQMIYALLEVGELCVGDLAGVVGSSESATSHQLRQLRLAGLVRSRKEGRTVYYRVADTHVRLLLDVAIEHYIHDHDDH